MAQQDPARLAASAVVLCHHAGSHRSNERGCDCKEIDRGGRARDERADFSFFRKTSADLCTSILQQNEYAGTILRQYLARIEDARLKRAFASAIDLNQAPAARKPEKDKKKDGNDGLWRGLAPRGDIRSRAC